MRPIKFKAKAKLSLIEMDVMSIPHKDGWVYGHLITDGNTAYILHGIADVTDQNFQPEIWVPVDIESIGQFTGFKDKECINIYEKDILSCSETAIVLGKRTAVKVNKVVVYSEKYAQYFLNKGKSNEHLTFVDFYDAEVVGNTYDNPELIDGVIND